MSKFSRFRLARQRASSTPPSAPRPISPAASSAAGGPIACLTFDAIAATHALMARLPKHAQSLLLGGEPGVGKAGWLRSRGLCFGTEKVDEWSRGQIDTALVRLPDPKSAKPPVD